MNINWYPGHMKKTIEDIEEKLKLVDFGFMPQTLKEKT